MTSRATGCWRSLNEIADLRMTPVVQTRAIADLDHPDPEVVMGAIQTLGRHGSPAALEPLRAAFQRWHVAWAGRASELEYSGAVERPHARQSMVEDAFRQAIGTGRNWLARTSDLRDLQALCVTENCRTQTGHMIQDDDTRIKVWDITRTRRIPYRAGAIPLHVDCRARGEAGAISARDLADPRATRGGERRRQRRDSGALDVRCFPRPVDQRALASTRPSTIWSTRRRDACGGIS